MCGFACCHACCSAHVRATFAIQRRTSLPAVWRKRDRGFESRTLVQWMLICENSFLLSPAVQPPSAAVRLRKFARPEIASLRAAEAGKIRLHLTALVYRLRLTIVPCELESGCWLIESDSGRPEDAWSIVGAEAFFTWRIGCDTRMYRMLLITSSPIGG